jgi:hypothetical protein
MIVLGLILLVLGWLLGIHLLVTLGIIVVAIGLILVIVGLVGHPVGGRSHWY